MRCPSIRHMVAVAVGVLACGSAWQIPSARGDPLSPSFLPATTRWVIHFDVDKARFTPLWRLVGDRFYRPNEVMLNARLQVLERALGIRLPADLRDVTLYAPAFDEASVCLRVHAAMDRTTAERYVRGLPAFREYAYGTSTIFSWREEERNRMLFACFAGSDILFLSSSAGGIESALDTHQGKAPSLKPTSALAPQAPASGTQTPPPAPFLWIAAEGLTALPHAHRPESPAITPLQTASLGIDWVDDRLLIRTRATTLDEQSAAEVQSLVLGIKAFVSLSARDPSSSPEIKALKAAMEGLTVSASGTTVRGEWTVTLQQVEGLMEAKDAPPITGMDQPPPLAAPRNGVIVPPPGN